MVVRLVRASKRLYPLDDVARNYSGNWRVRPAAEAQQSGARAAGAKGEWQQGNEAVDARCIGREQQSTARRWRQARSMDKREQGVAVMASVGGVSYKVS
jgi:hypothetical protein